MSEEQTKNYSTQKFLSIYGVPIFGALCTWMCLQLFSDYAIGLFIVLPIVMGYASTVIYARNRYSDELSLAWVSIAALCVYAGLLLIFALDGLICILMAMPIGIVCTLFGYLIAKYVYFEGFKSSGLQSVWWLFILMPIFMGAEHMVQSGANERKIVTSIIVHASAEEVWQQVVQFDTLDEPASFIFNAGIAYPTHATIDGSGVGAVRKCYFSTGPFVEPITVWDEPRKLAFDVIEHPAPMHEVSPYPIQPKHLDGYWESQRGQFILTPQPDGTTLLEGTTWYISKIRPAFYWNLWSDYIVHSIHNRVLEHIKKEAEER